MSQSAAEPQQEPPRAGSPEEVALVVAAQEGSETAFAALVETYHRLVFKVAYNKCSDHTDAEDLTQEILLHAFRSLPSLREPKAFLGWLLSLSHNRIHRFLRQRRTKIVALDELRRRAEEEQRYGADEPVDGSIPEVVKSLPEDFRLALTWKYLDGCSYTEIGERLSMSFHQVDYLLRRAKNALRAAVQRETNAEDRG
ncbi:MAG: sigma-70 family RNA polymerase sigma factor [Planctomycetota bacterium]